MKFKDLNADQKIIVREFATDLRQLLAKHKASLTIMMSDCSDTHGIHDIGIGVTLPIKHNRYDEDVRLSYCYGLDVHDLKELNKES